MSTAAALLFRSVAFSIVLSFLAGPGLLAQTEPRRVPDEILVTFREGLTDPACRASIAAAGHTVLRRFRRARNPASEQNRRYLVRIQAGESLDEALQSALRMPGVEAAQPNFIYRALQAPNDTYYYLQWALENTGDNPAYTEFGLHGPDPWVSDADIDFESARDLYAGWPLDTVVVGVIDSGVDLQHPDLAAMLWTNPGEVPGNGVDDDLNGFVDDVRGWDFLDDDNDPDDVDGHGTHVAWRRGCRHEQRDWRRRHRAERRVDGSALSRRRRCGNHRRFSGCGALRH